MVNSKNLKATYRLLETKYNMHTYYTILFEPRDFELEIILKGFLNNTNF